MQFLWQYTLETNEEHVNSVFTHTVGTLQQVSDHIYHLLHTLFWNNGLHILTVVIRDVDS